MSGSIAWEVNFDGLVGQTHNYAGLSFGNVASASHGGQVSSPRRAALQGLEKAWSLARMGFKQAILPPQERPHIPTLRQLGFCGSNEEEVLSQAGQKAPHLLAAACSASSMWVANAATISPFADTADGNTHLTPANLCSMFHRSIEPCVTGRVLRAVFADSSFRHHPPLPAGAHFADEGAANHTRFCSDYDSAGVSLFVYGDDQVPATRRPQQFPARQTLAASEAIVRHHGLEPSRVIYARQNPEAIDAGVFHNDVIATGNRQLLFHHEQAFVDTAKVKEQLQEALKVELQVIEVAAKAVSLEQAVRSYLFNSQLLSLPDDDSGALLLAPIECKKDNTVHRYLQELEVSGAGINSVQYVDLGQSMNNGGGPACLRLRVVMNDSQIRNCQAHVFMDDCLNQELQAWINRHYRDSLAPSDLTDPALLMECRTALDELSQLLNIGSVYDFQREPL
ncbi:MAG: N-succinylarginine dihydrolase [Gammaproteobacteria bacterium]|nr:N-succinylarginine dihydrolase [Gammaproteobacteria bacterium]MCY4356136.1 N-succinylarginine dihydrolase [Gammaproteobacteria bacterium]